MDETTYIDLKKCLRECMKKYSFLLFFTGGAGLRALAQECYKKCKELGDQHAEG
jgi:hypothetical protein